MIRARDFVPFAERERRRRLVEAADLLLRAADRERRARRVRKPKPKPPAERRIWRLADLKRIYNSKPKE